MNINGQERPIYADLDGPLFADAAGAGQSWPIASCDGYTATFRNFDLQKQKVKVMQLKVAGKESVTVPAAGTFDAFRVEVTSAGRRGGEDNALDRHRRSETVKVSSVVPQMGGAVLTAELTA